MKRQSGQKKQKEARRAYSLGRGGSHKFLTVNIQDSRTGEKNMINYMMHGALRSLKQFVAQEKNNY